MCVRLNIWALEFKMTHDLFGSFFKIPGQQNDPFI